MHDGNGEGEGPGDQEAPSTMGEAEHDMGDPCAEAQNQKAEGNEAAEEFAGFVFHFDPLAASIASAISYGHSARPVMAFTVGE